MNVPAGYSALDLVGFTDKGAYSASAVYAANDIVHLNGNNLWRCLIDDTTGIEPAEGANWTIFLRSDVGDMSELKTTDKSSMVAALNEVIDSSGKVPDGGRFGQTIIKQSDAREDAEWQDPVWHYGTIAEMNAALGAGTVPANGATIAVDEDLPGGSLGDTELDPLSVNWVQNQAITKAINQYGFSVVDGKLCVTYSKEVNNG